MEELKSIVVLIDADNAQLKKIDPIFREISVRGKIFVKRAYGNWTRENLINWGPVVNRFGIKTIQQFDLTRGTDEIPPKNATDISLVVDAMELLQRNLYDTFVIVGGDSDYTPLVHKLKDYLKDVIVVGQKNTAMALRKACTEFIALETLADDESILEYVEREKVRRANMATAVPTAEPPQEEPAPVELPAPTDAAEVQEEIKEEPAPFELPEAPAEEDLIEDHEDELAAVHQLLHVAAETYANEAGYTNISQAGFYVKRMRPDFSPKTYGATNFPKFLEKFPEIYEIKRYKGKGTVTIVGYRCID